VVKLVDTPS